MSEPFISSFIPSDFVLSADTTSPESALERFQATGDRRILPFLNEKWIRSKYGSTSMHTETIPELNISVGSKKKKKKKKNQKKQKKKKNYHFVIHKKKTL